MISKEAIVTLYGERKKRLAPYHSAGQVIRDVIEGNHDLVLSELNQNEKSSVANLMLTGVEQLGMRIASVLPVIDSPPLRTGRSAQRRAVERKNTCQAWWYYNKVPLLARYRARDYVALATSPILVRPGREGIPCWEWKDPLATFPAPMGKTELVPADCIFSFRRSWAWLRTNYADVTLPGNFTRGDSAKHGDDQMFTILQYIDDEDHVMVAVGETTPGANEIPKHFEMSRVPNKAGRPLVVIPGRITVGALQGQFDQMIGMYELQSELWALNLHAIRRSIFKETWVAGDDPEIETVANPYDGTVGVVKGGTVAAYGPDPGVQTQNAINMLERAQRLVGGVPADFGGESPSNVRTARRGANVLSAVVDYPVQEAQESLAASMEEELEIAIDIAKAYWPNTTRTFAMPQSTRPVTYTPASTFEEGACAFVRYSFAGSDVDGLVIAGGQRIGMGTLSQRSFMDIDPLVVDSDLEHDRIVAEALEKAHISAIQSQAADPNGPYQPTDLARLTQLIVEQNMPVYEAEQKVHEEIQARQAQAAQGQLSPEEMQPGNAIAGAPGTPQAAEPIGEPQPSMNHLTSLLANLRLQQRSTPQEAAVG